MKILRESQNSHLPLQLVDHYNKTYRTSRYVVCEGRRYFNTLTGEAIEVEDFNKDLDKLIEKWFLIPTDFDEASVYYLSSQISLKSRGQKRNGKTSFTIFTATGCNANCYYCYEKNKDNSYMTKDTAESLAKYIKLRGSYDKDHPVRLYWFGGEPLINQDAITTVCEFLSDHNVSFSSHLTTNGFLLSTISDETLKDVWHLIGVQMSFEGLGRDYENAKGVSSGVSEKAIEAVKRISKLGATVTIRLNLDPDIGIKPLKDVVSRFKDVANLIWNPALLYQKRTEEGYKQLLELQDWMSKEGTFKFRLPSINYRGCLVDNPRSCCITVDGKLAPCTHYPDETYGSVFDGKNIFLDREVIEKWKTRQKDTKETCKKCTLYPKCHKLVHCDAVCDCSAVSVNYEIEKIKRALKEMPNGGMS